MANKTTNIFTRVDPVVKEQAETVLNQLGVSMATAMEIYLRQIAFQKKIPFDLSLPKVEKPKSYTELSELEFNAGMDRAFAEYASGECVSI